MPEIFHFTCSCCAPQIRRTGHLRSVLGWDRYDASLQKNGLPASGLGARPGLVWLTPLSIPDSNALGLTSTFLKCDRTEWRVTVDRTPAVETWTDYKARTNPNRDWLAFLEAFGKPELWLVSESNVRVKRVEKMASVNA